MTMEVEIIPVLSDNYIYLFHDNKTQITVVVDPAEAAPVMQVLNKKGWPLTHIINTHHHWDHIGGNTELKKRYNCEIIGPASEIKRIPAMDHLLRDGDTLQLGRFKAKIFEVPGHTTGHIIYWFEEEDVLFSGDTLFSLGCGRLFEGTPEQMWSSLQKIRGLPEQTRVYCTHEYTLSNGAFALTLEPDNEELKEYLKRVNSLRQDNKPSLPSSIALEKQTNPFLRVDCLPFQKAGNFLGQDPVAIFTEIRKRKDQF